MTDNDKRLARVLAANDMGVRLYEEDGRVYFQWLRPHVNESADALNFELAYKKAGGEDLPTGVVGNLDKALDVIDEVLLKIFPNGEMTLLNATFAAPGGIGRWGIADNYPKRD